MSEESAYEKYLAQTSEMIQTVALFGERLDEGNVDIEHILRTIGAYRARLFWLNTRIKRSNNRELIRLKTDVIDPFMDELTEQFNIWSRVFTIQQHEWNMTRG